MKYSTLQHVFPSAGISDRVGKDHEDGGGFGKGAALRKLCAWVPADEKVIRGSARWASTQGQGGNVSPDAEPAFPDVPPGEQNLKGGLNQSLVPQPGMTGYRFDTIATESLAAGDRFRFTFSWNRCNVASSTGSTPGTQVDFDLFLYNETLGQGLYASQTADDVNEGFDVVIPAGWAGTYKVLVYWPTNASFCGTQEETAWTGWLKRA